LEEGVDSLGSRGLALKALVLYEKGKNADISFLNTVKKQKEQRDIDFAKEIFFGVVRWIYRIDYILDKHIKKGNVYSLPSYIRNILRIGIYSHLFTNIPDYANVNEMVQLAKEYGHTGTASLVNGVLRNVSDVEYPRERIKYLSIFYSFPEWLILRLEKVFGEDVARFLKASNERSKLTLRINRLYTRVDEVYNKLKSTGIWVKKARYYPYSIYSEGKALKSRYFFSGLYTVQDESSSLATELLKPKKNDIVADLCASPGGKATLISELMNNEGILLVSDIKRIDRIIENKNRLRIKNMYIFRADARDVKLRKVNRILLDVPCSGLGTLTKRVDLKYRIKENSIKRLTKIQSEILSNAANNIVTGGRILYSTCTIFPEENEEIIKNFLAKNKNFDLIRYEGRFGYKGFFKTLPQRDGIDGLFAGLLIKRR